MAQFFADKGALDSVDQTSFGQSNFGYRYFLNFSPNSELLDFNSSQVQGGGILSMFPQGFNVPFKGMFILTQKQDDLYGILFLSPRENFDSVLKEIQTTIDSIQITNSTTSAN